VLQIEASVFQQNSANTSGGAVMITNGLVSLTKQVSLRGNAAGEFGGALYMDGTAALDAADTVWRDNNLTRPGSIGNGQHVYAAAGAGVWNFSGVADFEHVGVTTSGLYGAKTDGAHGLLGANVTCPAGAVATAQTRWVGSFTAVSGDWRLAEGVTTETTTHYAINATFTANDSPYYPVKSNITVSDTTMCEAEYFANWRCSNPPPIYPPMKYEAVSIGCSQCSRSEVALPAGTAVNANSGVMGACYGCPDEWTSSGAAACESGHVVQSRGFWRAEQGGVITKDTKFWECYTHEDACLGSATITAGAPLFDAQCAEGHTGPVCALCKPSFAMVHSKCKPCPPGALAAIGSAVAILVCTVGLVAAAYLNRKRLGLTKRASSIKIIIGFYSLLAVLEQTFAIAWPAGFQRALTSLKAVFASVMDFSSFACAVRVDWFQRVAFLCLALITVLVGLLVSFARALSAARRAGGDGAAEAGLTRPARTGKVAWLLSKVFGAERPPELDVEYSGKAFNAMLLVYPFLSPAVVAVFNCREVAGDRWLVSDYSLRCYDARWYWWAAVSALVCACYVAGLPILAFVSVIRRSPSIEFIAAGYRTDGGRIILGWEVVEMVRKFLLTSAVIFWPKGSCVQVAVAVMVSMFFLGFHLYHMPYDTRADNWFQVLALAGLLLVYFMGLLIKVQPNLEQRYGFDALLQLVAFAVAAIVVAVPIIHKARLFMRKRSAGRATQSQEQAIAVELSEALLPPGEGNHTHYTMMGDGDVGAKTSGDFARLQDQFEKQLQAERQKREASESALQRSETERASLQEQLQREQEARASERTALQEQLGLGREQEQRASAERAAVHTEEQHRRPDEGHEHEHNQTTD
jgi:hypothetical protein